MDIIIFLIMGCIIVSLVLGLFYFITHKNRQDEKHLAQSLTVRIVLSMVLFIVLLFSYCMGWLHPHGLPF